MRSSHPRRIIRRAVTALAVVVLLPVWYVGAWLVWPRIGDGSLYGRTPTLVAAINRFFEPLDSYILTGNPGSDELNRLWWWANPEYFIPEPEEVEASTN